MGRAGPKEVIKDSPLADLGSAPPSITQQVCEGTVVMDRVTSLPCQKNPGAIPGVALPIYAALFSLWGDGSEG